MKAQLTLDEKEVKFWIEEFKTKLTAHQAELNKQLPSFIELERDYLKWKEKVDSLKEIIRTYSSKVDTLTHFDNFKHQPKPRLVHPLSTEVVQEQIVLKKRKFLSRSEVPLPNIKWGQIIVPILEKEQRFMLYKEVWDMIKDKIGDNQINKRRFQKIFSNGAYNGKIWQTHNKRVGHMSLDLSKHLNDFLKSA